MIGIYALWFEETSMIYIGQSQNIKTRYREHLNKLKNSRHTNYKVQNCYNKFGEPELIILEECLLAQSNDLEIFWTAEFDSIDKGLNIIEAGQVGYGTNSNNSKYSRIQVLKVFSLLYRTTLTYLEIANKLNIHPKLVGDIKCGRTHVWLKEYYPKQYSKLERRFRNQPKGDVVTFIDSIGQRYFVEDIANFCRSLEVDNPEQFRKGLSKVRSGTLKSYKGWIRE